MSCWEPKGGLLSGGTETTGETVSRENNLPLQWKTFLCADHLFNTKLTLSTNTVDKINTGS